MDLMKSQWCAICGDEASPAGPWFLVAENRWEDKLTILHWNDAISSRSGVRAACNAAHVQELVVHWMTTGSLDYPFARPAAEKASQKQPISPAQDDLSPVAAQRIGELSVDRSSLKRVLSENPHALKAILDALLDALYHVPGCLTVSAESRDSEDSELKLRRQM